MNTTIIILMLFFGFLAGCSSSKHRVNGEALKIAEATYRNWREAPETGSGLPEVGTDLTIMVESWPEGFVPAYVVFRGKKSVSVKITRASDAKEGIIIHAKIIRTSSVLMERSDATEASDRFVYLNSNRKMRFIEIREWKEVKK